VRKEAKLVLLVEDNEDDELMTMETLKTSSTEVEIAVARDGEEALDWLFSRGEHAERNTVRQPDLVLLDIRLPKRSGLEVLAAIRADPPTRRLPVVMLTSSNEITDVQRAYDLYTNSYVSKPVRHDEFVRVVSCLSQYWTAYNETISAGTESRKD
jgi:two-component system, response regulator